MCPMFVTECFHNKCFKLSTLHSVYISPGCESDMILSVMTLVIKRGCLTTWGRVLCNGKMASLSRELPELVSLQNFEGKQCHQPSHCTQVEHRSEIIEHCPLVALQTLGQSEAFLPLSPGRPQPIRDFPTIEPGTLQSQKSFFELLKC